MSAPWPEITQHLEKIPYFVAVAKAGSLQRAARELRIAQPSLTRSMQLLEAALKVTLLTRGRKGVTLTPAGEELRRFAEPFLASLAGLERQLRDIGGDAAAGDVRLGTHEILVREFWPALVRGMRKTAPKLGLTLYTTPSVGELTRRLIAAELDVIVSVECPPKPDLVRHEVRSDAYGLYASAAFCREANLGPRTKLTVAKLTDLPLVYAAEVIAGPGIHLVSALRAAGLDKPSLYAVHSLESVASLVEAGLGIGFLPRLMVTADPKNRLIELRAPTLAGGRLGVHRLYVATTTASAKEARVKDLMARIRGMLER